MKLLNYWKNLNEREQLSLGFAGLFCAVYLFYMVIYSPLVSELENKNMQLHSQRETLAWMQKTQQQYRHLNKITQPMNNSKLLSLIASELSQPTFNAYTYQMQQTGSGDIELSFDKVPYNAFVKWLWETTHRYTIHIKDFHVEHSKTSGIVKLTLLLTTNT